MITVEGPTMARRKRASPRLGTLPARLANHRQQERGTTAKTQRSSRSVQPVFQGGIAPPGPGGPSRSNVGVPLMPCSVAVCGLRPRSMGTLQGVPALKLCTPQVLS